MTLRLKNTSEIAKVFGITSIGAFANNEAIKNNPEIIRLLLAKKARKQTTKKSSAFEKNYYQKLLARSEAIKAERSSTEPTKKALSLQIEKNRGQRTFVAAAQISELAPIINALPELYWQSEKGRYYRAIVERNLFGSYSLIKLWGGISNRFGNYQIKFYDNLDDVLDAITLLMKERRYKKYRLSKCLNLPQAI